MFQSFSLQWSLHFVISYDVQEEESWKLYKQLTGIVYVYSELQIKLQCYRITKNKRNYTFVLESDIAIKYFTLYLNSILRVMG